MFSGITKAYESHLYQTPKFFYWEFLFIIIFKFRVIYIYTYLHILYMLIKSFNNMVEIFNIYCLHCGYKFKLIFSAIVILKKKMYLLSIFITFMTFSSIWQKWKQTSFYHCRNFFSTKKRKILCFLVFWFKTKFLFIFLFFF